MSSRSSSSSTASPPDWLVVGRVVKPHGVHGDVLADIITDFPDRLVEDVRFGLGTGDAPSEFHTVHRVRVHKHRWLISVEGIRDREVVEAWRGHYLFLPEQPRDELPDGYYYEHHLEGLQCRSVSGEELGKVIGVDSGPGQCRLTVQRGGREYLVPYVPEIVVEVDLEHNVVIVDPPPGLLDDNAVEA